MGDPAKRLSEEEELAELLAAGGGGDASPDDELKQLLTADAKPDPIKARLDSPQFAAETEHVNQMMHNPLYLLTQMGKTGANYLGGAIGAAGEGAGVLANAGRQALGAGVSAGSNAYLDDPEHSVLSALLEGGKAAGIAGGAALGLGGIERAAQGPARSIGQAASEQRLRGAGIGADDIERMGPQATDQMARKIEAERLHVGPGMLGELPQGPRTYARNANALGQRGNETMIGAENEINQLPERPSVDVGNIVATQRARATGLNSLADPINEPQVSFRRDLASNLESDTIDPGNGPQRIIDPSGWNGHEFKVPGQVIDLPTNELSWPRALEQRRNLDQNVNWNRGMPAVGTAAANDATRKEVAGGLRGAIDTALNSPSVPAELAAQWRQGRDQFSFASDVGEPALKALGQGQSPSVPTSAGRAMNLLARSGGHSALAGTGRAVEGAFNGISNNAGAASEMTGAASAGAMQNQREQTQQKGRGDLLSQATQMVLQRNPQALGQYAQRLQEAEQDGTLSQVLFKLQQSDPQFSSSIYPQLLSLTAKP